MSTITSPPSIIFTVRRRRRHGPPAAVTDASPVSAASQAFAALHTLCGAASAAVSGATFGPFSNSGSCDYDCGLKTQGWSWSVDYTNWAGANNLLPAVAAMDASAGYDEALTPTTAWLTESLPAATSALNEVLGSTIPQIDEAIINSGGETPQQTLALTAAFNSAFTIVTGCMAELNNALQSVATFIDGKSPMAGSLQSLIASMQTWVDNDINSRAENLEGKLSCGGTDVQFQYIAVQYTVDASLVSLGPPLNSVNSEFLAAMSAASDVAGVFLNIQPSSQVVTDQIALAQDQLPTSPLRTLHLNIAVKEWADLASYAQAQLAITTAATTQSETIISEERL